MQNEAKISRILGIDFGTAKIGLAMAEAETRIAFVYATLKNDGNFWTELADIIEKEGIDRIVIGIPGYIHREKQKTKGEEMGDILKLKIPQLEISYQNEMFTTISAQDNLHAKGVKNAGKHDDAEAAKIILQEWLEKNIKLF